MVRSWARTTCRILGVSVLAEGPVPSPPFLLVTNHLSYLDIVVLLCRVRGDFVAKSDVRRWPVLGHFAAVAGTLFLDRGSQRDAARVGSLMAKRMAGGRGIILFPEGTSTDGSAVAPFKAAMLNPAAAAEIPVHCAGLAYVIPHPGYDARRDVCWWGDMTFGGHFLRLLSIPRIHARISFAPDCSVGGDRKGLAAELHEKVTGLAMGTDRPIPPGGEGAL